MRDITFPETGSKRKLLDAAEQLFAEKGFEAVSIRDITQLAQVNVAAVSYHFGSREGLMTSVMMRYMTPLTQERIAALDALERKRGAKDSVPLGAIVEAFAGPLVSQVKKTELSNKLFYKLLGRIFAYQGDGLSPVLEEQFESVMQRYTKAIAKALPTMASDELAWRIHFMSGGMIHMLTQHDQLQSQTHGGEEMEETLSRFLKFAIAGLQGAGTAESVLKAQDDSQKSFDF